MICVPISIYCELEVYDKTLYYNIKLYDKPL